MLADALLGLAWRGAKKKAVFAVVMWTETGCSGHTHRRVNSWGV